MRWHPSQGRAADRSTERHWANLTLWRAVKYDAAARSLPPEAEADLVPTISREWAQRQAESCRRAASAVLAELRKGDTT